MEAFAVRALGREGHRANATGDGPMMLTLVGKRREAPDVTSFLFRSEGPLSWRAGQFLRYRLPHADPDGRGTARFFTIASAPHEGHVMLTTRFDPARGSSFKRALGALPVGAPVEVGKPAGDFVLADPEARHVLIAGGIGITPFRAMLVDLDHRELPLTATVLYAHRGAEAVYGDELAALHGRHPRLTVQDIVSPERITADVLRAAVAEFEAPTVYVSGPEPFVRAIESVLSALGVPEARVKRDYFPGYDWREP
ncbi:MAG TPA: FAD-dependent oxidoreductase [Methylomirabilota bacterium]|jgi:ferredoxin-NADP reductase|nr:FAD-dependent oxidoreductase [Methylomirabilota bacterium]